ncbi:unnamed protein product [Sympodiomycopsis kandeliae]
MSKAVASSATANMGPVSAPDDAVYSFRLLEALRSGDQKLLHPFLSKAVLAKGPVNELTSPLHIAVRCAEYNTIQLCLDYRNIEVNTTEAQNGNTPLHIAASLGRADVVQLLLSNRDIDDTKRNKDGKEPLEVAHTPDIAQLIQVSRAELNVEYLEVLSAWEQKQPGAEQKLYELLDLPRVGAIDLNVQTNKTGTTLLHEAVARKDTRMIETAVRKGADVYARNRKGKSALDSSRDEKVKALLRQFSNADAAIAAQSVPGQPPTFRGYLAKWTNLAGGYKTRWFVLQDGVLSYYHSSEEEGKQSRGSVNLRFAKFRADSNDKHRFEIISEGAKGSSKLYLRGSHPVERARWVQVLQQTQAFFNLERVNSRSDSVAGQPGTSSQNASAGASMTNISLAPSRVATPALNKTTSTNNALLSAQPGQAGAVPMPTPLVSSQSAAQTSGILRTPSLISRRSSPSDDRDDSEGFTDNEALFDVNGKPRIPHSDTFPLLAGALKLKFELALQLAHSLPVSNTGTTAASSSSESVPRQSFASTRQGELGRPAPPLSSSSNRQSKDLSHLDPSATSLQGIKSALEDALSQTDALFGQFGKLVDERESYLLRRYEQEIAAKRLWEDNMKTLAQQHAEMEAQLREAASENARRRKALREVRDNASSSPASGVVSPQAQRGAVSLTDTIADRREGVEPMKLSKTVLAQPVAMRPSISEDVSGRTSVDDEDEFFDAIETGNLPGMKVETPMAQASQEKDWPADFDSKLVNDASIEPYRELRKKLPIGKDDRPSVSLWAILKNNIGKDLTKISFPVSFNEPTSMLQRMAEDMEFSECLDAAATQESSTVRTAFVAAFAMSNYSSTIGRVAKPFNPLLGETFEYQRPDKHYRYVSEQVSHHPPVSACLAQSPLWDYMGCVDAKSKFLGRTFEIRPTGVAHVQLKIPQEWAPKDSTAKPANPNLNDRVTEHYTWNKVTTSVSGFIVGSPTIDHVGDLTVTNHVTGDKCTLTFKPRGWKASNAREISGQVWDGKGNLRWEIAGRWDSQLVARKVGTGLGVMNPDESFRGSFTAEPQPLAEYILLWKNSEKPPNTPFNLTPFAITLNDLPPTLPKWLPPTDCRTRPDLSSFEEGRFDEANELKQNLEDYQRTTRKKRETGELPAHEPRWFTKSVDPDTGETLWKPKSVEHSSGVGPVPEYWNVRDQVGSSGDKNLWKSEHIYGPYESRRFK